MIKQWLWISLYAWGGANGTLLTKLTTDRQTARYPRDLLSNSNRGRNPELHELIAQKAPDQDI
jgi:hypothetical protein